MRCDLQIFSGCVCHLEQLHAQSPFLFPIVFSINLIPFFDICSGAYLLFFHPGCSGMCCFTWAAARSQQYTLLSKRQASCLYNHALEHSTGSERVDAFGLREMVLGKSRQAHQRTIMHSNTRQAANNHALEQSTGSERVDAFGLREMVLGKSRQAHQRPAGSPANGRLTSERKAYLPLPIVTHQSLDPAARALKRQASCLLRGLTSEQSCTRTLDRQRQASCLLRVAFATRRRGNHMHDHSRFQRDID